MSEGFPKNKTALIVEGGGMRGIFTAGVLDAFMEAKFDPFDLYIGVSSGALNLSSHLAGQYRRNYEVITKYGTHPEFINFKKFIKGGHLMDMDWMFDICQREYPVDVEAAVKSLKGKQFFMVSTDIQTGEAVYLEPNANNWEVYAKASSTLPLVYRSPVYINGRRYMDGGLSDPLPVQEAYRRGVTRIVLLRTRPYDYRKQRSTSTYINALLFRKFPAFKQAVLQHPATYNRALKYIHQPPLGLEIVHIAPTHALASHRTTRDIVALNQDYHLGKKLGQQALNANNFFKNLVS